MPMSKYNSRYSRRDASNYSSIFGYRLNKLGSCLDFELRTGTTSCNSGGVPER